MNASILDFRRRMRDILRALDRNEPVTILYRGRKKGVIRPVSAESPGGNSVKSYRAFGMWKDREEMRDVAKSVDRLRKGRFDAL